MRFHWKKESFYCHLDEIRSISVIDTKTRKKELSEKVHIMIEFQHPDMIYLYSSPREYDVDTARSKAVSENRSICT